MESTVGQGEAIVERPFTRGLVEGLQILQQWLGMHSRGTCIYYLGEWVLCFQPIAPVSVAERSIYRESSPSPRETIGRWRRVPRMIFVLNFSAQFPGKAQKFPPQLLRLCSRDPGAGLEHEVSQASRRAIPKDLSF